VKDIVGLFGRGDTVSIVTGDGLEVARGMVAYDSGDAQKIKGLKSVEIMKVLGAAGRDEIIHRDDLVMMTGEK
jgi:glutamate 5-kinase